MHGFASVVWRDGGERGGGSVASPPKEKDCLK